MAVRQNVSMPIIIVVLGVVVLIAYVAFSRSELAPPGVGEHHHGHDHGEETLPLPATPSAEPREIQAIAKGLLPMGVAAVFPPLVADRQKGVRMALVAPGSPAERAGLKPADLLTEFDGRKLSHPFALAAALEQVAPDKEYRLVVVRDGEQHALTITGLKPLPLEERVR